MPDSLEGEKKLGLVATGELQAGETTSVDAETGAAKGTKLARYDLIPPIFLEELAKHYGRGALKYADNQWRAGYDYSKSYSALQRHLNAFWSGEFFDPDPNMPGANHLAAAAWHIATLVEFFFNNPTKDDRYLDSMTIAEAAEKIEKLKNESDS